MLLNLNTLDQFVKVLDLRKNIVVFADDEKTILFNDYVYKLLDNSALLSMHIKDMLVSGIYNVINVVVCE